MQWSQVVVLHSAIHWICFQLHWVPLVGFALFVLNLILDQLIIPELIFFFILVAGLLVYNSYNISLENLVFDQLTIPELMFFFSLIAYLVDIVLIL